MEISRRDFLKYVSASAAALGLSSVQLGQVERAVAASSGPPVLWLQGAACTGCSVSLLNTVNPTIDHLLLNTINLRYHSNLMGAAGDLAVAQARSTQQAGGYVLVVEGAIPTGSSGKFCYVWDEGGKPVTMADAVRSLAANAKHIVAVGTCAAYGGIPKAYSTAGAQGVGAFLGKPVINIPGCPAHPEWILGTITQILSGSMPALDGNRRPTAYFKSQPMHERCPRKEKGEAKQFGVDGRCQKELGCKGEKVFADCEARQWNNKQGWCVGVNGMCIGCTEPSFPAFPLHKG